MHIYLQWIVDPSEDWEMIDHTAWSHTPYKPPTVANEQIDASPGWIHRVNVQGMIFSGDHIAIMDVNGLCQVSVWDNDPEELSSEAYHGEIFTFPPLCLTSHGWDTQIAQKIYHGQDFLTFPLPPLHTIRHGRWMPDTLAMALDAYAPVGWADWIPHDD